MLIWGNLHMNQREQSFECNIRPMRILLTKLIIFYLQWLLYSLPIAWSISITSWAASSFLSFPFFPPSRPACFCSSNCSSVASSRHFPNAVLPAARIRSLVSSGVDWKASFRFWLSVTTFPWNSQYAWICQTVRFNHTYQQTASGPLVSAEKSKQRH